MADTLHDVPLFPLGTVLFPDGLLPLKIFETRYMDMAKTCLKNGVPFGVCLIVSGRETGAPALPHAVGTLARIENWDMPQLGVLHVQCRGGERFRILTKRIESSGLQRADIELLASDAHEPLSPAHEILGELMARIIDNIEDTTLLQPLRLDDAAWVSWRLADLLPLSLAEKQEVLELDNCGARLDRVHRFLHDKGLLNPSR